MTDPWTSQLSRYVDAEMPTHELTELEKHLEACTECRRIVDELQQVRSWADAFSGDTPHPRVWKGIAGAIQAPPLRVIEGDAAKTVTRRPHMFRFPKALAAGIALVIVCSGSFWLARATAPVPAAIVIPVTWEPAAGPTSQSTLLAAQRYATAVAQLESALLNGEIEMDTATVRVLRQKLAVVDRAIDEARQAVADDPNSGYLAQHFARMMKQKLALLRNTARGVVES